MLAMIWDEIVCWFLKIYQDLKHSSFDGLIQEDIDLSDIYLAVRLWVTRFLVPKKSM